MQLTEEQKYELQRSAIRTYTLEAEALQQLAQTVAIQEGFAQCVAEILAIKGRVIVTGVGKSAIIAQKIVATFNSTGTPSLFLHAADAMHGDLGMVQPNDMVICLSKSGETAEIKSLVPLLKQRACRLAAIVAHAESYLAQQADFVLLTPLATEACPHNLAPTVSTTIQLATGDALAVAVLQLRGFSAADFARYHPGGALGKRLYLRVNDIYIRYPSPSVQLETPLPEVLAAMSLGRLGAVVVLDNEQAIVGIITDGDVRRTLQQQPNNMQCTAADMMTKNPKTIANGSLAIDALRVMQQYKITQIIVSENNRYVGLLHIHHLLQEGL